MLRYEFKGGQMDKKFYEEAYYISGYYNSIIKKPHKKAKSMTTEALLMIWGGIALAVGSILLGFLGYSKIMITATATVGILVAFVFIKINFSYKKAINQTMVDNTDKVYTISEEKITFKSDEKEYSTVWSKISCVIFNTNTIGFLPKEVNGVLYVLPIECADEIKNFMKNSNLESLIIDNRVEKK